jgi:hypothetical protein
MTSYGILLNLRAISLNPLLRFLSMFTGVVIIPTLVILLPKGNEAAPLDLVTLSGGLLLLGAVLLTSLLLGLWLFQRSANQLSISSSAAASLEESLI